MIRIYHENNDGDRVIETDCETLEDFERQLPDALLKFIEVDDIDLDFGINSMVPHLVQLIKFYTTGKGNLVSVRKRTFFTSGYEAPSTIPIVSVHENG